jgi:hypothetical protein
MASRKSSQCPAASMFATIGTGKLAKELGYVLTCSVESYGRLSQSKITLIELS